MNKLRYAVAALGLLMGPMAVAQSGGAVGSVGGTFDPSVNAQVDRSVNSGVRGNGGGGGKTQSHPSAASWAPTRNAAMAEQAAAKNKPEAAARAMENEAGSSSQEDNTPGSKKGTPKPGTMKKFGAASASTGTSSFGMASKSGSNQFGFSGKMQLAGSSHGNGHERTKEEGFEKEVAGHPAARSATHKRRRGREFMPKLSPLPHGEEDCKAASSLEMCNWL